MRAGPAPAGDRSVASPAAELPPIDRNDNREPAGILREGILELELEVRRGLWRPLGTGAEPVEVLAFGELGVRLQAPGPLIRVPQAVAPEREAER